MSLAVALTLVALTLVALTLVALTLAAQAKGFTAQNVHMSNQA